MGPGVRLGKLKPGLGREFSRRLISAEGTEVLGRAQSSCRGRGEAEAWKEETAARGGGPPFWFCRDRKAAQDDSRTWVGEAFFEEPVFEM